MSIQCKFKTAISDLSNISHNRTITGNRYAFFPSMALAWVVKNEDFLQSVNAISNLKLRASIGQTGNAGIGAYSTLATIANTNVVFGDKEISKGMVQSGMPNADLK